MSKRKLETPLFKKNVINEHIRLASDLAADLLKDADTQRAKEGDLLVACELSKLNTWLLEYRISMIANKGRVERKLNKPARENMRRILNYLY